MIRALILCAGLLFLGGCITVRAEEFKSIAQFAVHPSTNVFTADLLYTFGATKKTENGYYCYEGPSDVYFLSYEKRDGIIQYVPKIKEVKKLCFRVDESF